MSRILARKFALEIARNDGLTVVKGSPTRILLDLDEEEDVRFYREMLPIVQEHVKLVEEKEWRSKNGGLHVQLLSPRPLTIRTRLLIQACLGSDRVKEFLSLIRVWKKEPDPVMLFKPPEKKKGTVAYIAGKYSREVGNPLKRVPIEDTLYDDDIPF